MGDLMVLFKKHEFLSHFNWSIDKLLLLKIIYTIIFSSSHVLHNLTFKKKVVPLILTTVSELYCYK